MIPDRIIKLSVSNVWTRIISSISTSLNNIIDHHFRVHPSGYQFTGAFKDRKWDGFIHFYNSERKTIRTGHINDLIAILYRNKYSVHIIPDDHLLPHYDDHIEPCELASESYQMIAWQRTALCASIEYKRGLIKSPTGTGKTVLMANVVHSLINHGLKVLILLNRIDLGLQTRNQFITYGIDKNIISVVCSETDDEENIITIACVLSQKHLHNLPEYGAVLVDEAHHASADSYNAILNKCVGAFVRLGFSATYPVEQVDMKKVIGHMANIIYSGQYDYHIHNRTIADPIIYFVDYNINVDTSDEKFDSYAAMEDYHIVDNDTRNNAIVNIAKKFVDSGKKVLIMPSRRRHGDKLCGELGIEYLDGESNPEFRAEQFKNLSSGKTKIVCGSSGVCGEGIDIVGGIDVMILCNACISPVMTIQNIGRALRKNQQMKVAVFDFIDRSHKVFYKHSAHRMASCIDTYGKQRTKRIQL